MSKKTYELRILPLFEEDLNGIVDHITVVLQNPDAAERLVDDVQHAIRQRLTCAESFEGYRSSKRRVHPYYRIYVRGYVVFYVVIDGVMEVRRILYAKRDFTREV